MNVSPEIFNKFVDKALAGLPSELREKMDNVEIIVQDFADPETLEDMDLDSKWDLLGLYVGTPITERSVFGTGYMPELIYLYRQPILRHAGYHNQVADTIREVVIHEIGHHFGFSDTELYGMTEITD